MNEQTLTLDKNWNGTIRPYGDQFQWALVGSHPATVYARATGLAATSEEAEFRIRSAFAKETR